MLTSSAWRPFPRYMAEQAASEEADADVTPYEHDLILRYAILGIFVILFTGALYQMRVIAIPVTAGVIFGLVLGPLVDWMVRHRVPQHLSAALVVLLFVALLVMAIGVLAVPVAAWSDQGPAIMAALKSKLSGMFVVMEDFKRGLTGLTGHGGDISVSQGNPLMDIAVSSSAAAGGLLLFVATIYFWLATRRHLKARILRLCLGRSARKSAGSFFEEIEERVARYFALVTVINLGMGLLTTAIAWLAGLPFPIFWGALAFLLNYLAFIGPVIVAVALFAGALLDAPSVLAAAWPAAAYYGLHLVEGNAVTPMFVGSRLTISPFLVFIGFIFWLWLWGPVGAVLATPIIIVGIVAQEEFARYRLEKVKEEEEAQAESAAA